MKVESSKVRADLDEPRAVLGALRSEDILDAVDVLRRAYDDRARIFIFGNGGTAATELARARGASAVRLTDFAGGRLKLLCDVRIVVPSDHIENVHLALQHLTCHRLSSRLTEVPTEAFELAETVRP